MFIYHALIKALSAHMIHINLNMIFCTHAEHSPTKTIYIKYYTEKQTHALTHAHTHTRTMTAAETDTNISWDEKSRKAVYFFRNKKTYHSCLESNQQPSNHDSNTLTTELFPLIIKLLFHISNFLIKLCSTAAQV